MSSKPHRPPDACSARRACRVPASPPRRWPRSAATPFARSSSQRRRARSDSAGGDEQLHRRVREDDRADVAAVQHRATTGGEAALEVQQRRTHGRNGGHCCRRRVRGRSAQVAAIQVVRPAAHARPPRPPPDRRDRRRHPARVGRRRDTADRCRGRASPSVAASRRASVPFPAAAGPSMAMTRRPARHAVRQALRRRRFISSAKPGKLVSMKAVSSTVTGCSAASTEHQGSSWRCGGPCGSRPSRRPAAGGRRRARSGRRPRSATCAPFTASNAAVAATRSLSFTRSSFSPRMRVVPTAWAAMTASTGYSSIMIGARSHGTSTPPQFTVRRRPGRPPARLPARSGSPRRYRHPSRASVA